jgi:hypothetical protein
LHVSCTHIADLLRCLRWFNLFMGAIHEVSLLPNADTTPFAKHIYHTVRGMIEADISWPPDHVKLLIGLRGT